MPNNPPEPALQDHFAELCLPNANAGEVMMSELTQKAQNFLRDNATVPVISGSAYPKGGGRYTLANGRSYRLTLAEVRQIGMPKWPWDMGGDDDA